MIEVTIATIQVSLISQNRIVVLKEVEAERYLPIWIGPFEAEAITIHLQETETPRPLTHDLIGNLLDALGARLRYVAVISLVENIFYARLVLDIKGLTVEVDSRPSDAIAIAVRKEVPIYVDESVMEVAGIVPEPNLEEESVADQNLGAFRRFLDTLNLDGLERND